MHILYNALKEGLTRQPDFKDFLERLLALTSFVNDSELRRRFQHVCLDGQEALENKFSGAAKLHIDWKWEYLSKALDYFCPRIPILAKYYDTAKLKAGDAG